ncbi:MAG: HNH endonuclease [Synergistaceae bacterium]
MKKMESLLAGLADQFLNIRERRYVPDMQTQQMERIGIYSLEDVLPYIVASKRDVNSKRVYDGNLVNVHSLRLQLFKSKGVECIICGIKGSFFSLERPLHCKQLPKVYHFNLYALEDGGSIHNPLTWRLITQDHIIPKSKGGKDNLSNLQVMCTVCNCEKDNKIIT